MMLEFSRKSILQPQLDAGRSLIFDELSATALEEEGGWETSVVCRVRNVGSLRAST